MGLSDSLNTLGMISSTLCIIDCAVLPVLLIGLSLLGVVQNVVVSHNHGGHAHHDDHHGHDHHDHHGHGHHDEHAASGVGAETWINLAVANIQWFTHNVAFYFIVPLGALTLTLSFLQHRKFHVLFLGFFGISLLMSSHYLPALLAELSARLPQIAAHQAEILNFFETYHHQIEVLGSLTLLSAQWMNRKLCACGDDHGSGKGHGHSHGQKKKAKSQ